MTDETYREGSEDDSLADSLSTADIAGAALGALSPAEEVAVYDAAVADERIAAELGEMEAVVAELARLAPLRQINRGRSAGIRSRLVSRAAASREGRVGTPRSGPESVMATSKPGSSPPTSPRLVESPAASRIPPATVRPLKPIYRQSFNWLALAAGIAFVATGTTLVYVLHDRHRFRDAVMAQQTAMMRKVATLESSMATKDSMIASLTGPQMKVVDLVSRASQEPLARMFWDRKTQEWTMYAYHLRQPASGKTFQVWLMTNTSAKPISAGTFTPDAQGAAVMHAKYPLDREALQKVAISEEPAGGMPYPTGPILIAGEGR
jgi:hypothetical protein